MNKTFISFVSLHSLFEVLPARWIKGTDNGNIFYLTISKILLTENNDKEVTTECNVDLNINVRI